MAVTITDVAKLAGVSPSTVSRTCKDSPAISKATKEKVRQAMLKLGYEHPLVQNQQTICKIGVVFPKFRPATNENPFYLEALRGISKYCNERNLSMLIHTGESDEELLESIQASPADGFIFLYSDVDDKIIQHMYKVGALFVLIGKATENINNTIYVDTDNVQAGKEACDYLINLGHKAIAYIGTDKHRVFSSDRKAGYLLSLSEHGIGYKEDFCIELPTRIMSNYIKLEELLSRPDRPTALMICDDMLAIALMPTIQKLGLKIPEDLSLISFNNSLFAKLISPGLTSIDVNAYQLGYEACAQLSKHLEEPNLVATKTLIPHHLVERESCSKWEK